MSYRQVLIACRDSAEGERIRKAIGQPAAPMYHRASSLLESLVSTHECTVVMMPMMSDETAVGVQTKGVIDSSPYTILCACYCVEALNILRVYGCGCAHVLGPDELDLLPGLVSAAEKDALERVYVPFFVDDDESALKGPPPKLAQPVHLSFIGGQALMSCCNALLNITASSSMSMSCVAPANKWARERFEQCLAEYTLWSLKTKPFISFGSLTLCDDFKTQASLATVSQHFIICHGHLSDEERDFVSRNELSAQIYEAKEDGYLKAGHSGEPMDPEAFWDMLIKAQYTGKF